MITAKLRPKGPKPGHFGVLTSDLIRFVFIFVIFIIAENRKEDGKR